MRIAVIILGCWAAVSVPASVLVARAVARRARPVDWDGELRSLLEAEAHSR